MAGYDEAIYRTYLAQVPMFRRCTTAQIQELSELADGLAFDPNQVLVREGDLGDEFYVIGSGEAIVSREGHEVARLGVGDFFGEIALFADTPRDRDGHRRHRRHPGRPESRGVPAAAR